jgi:DNA-binding transcriptional MerR regulator
MTTEKASQASGVSERKLQIWCERGLLAPAKVRWSGPWGARRDWQPADIAIACAIEDLRRKGIELQVIRGMIRAIRRALEGYALNPSRAELYLMIDRKRGSSIGRLWSTEDPAQVIEHYKTSRGLDLIAVSDYWKRLNSGSLSKQKRGRRPPSVRHPWRAKAVGA